MGSSSAIVSARPDLGARYVGQMPLAVYGTLRTGQPAWRRLLAGAVAETFPAVIPDRRLLAVSETTGGGYAGYAMAVPAPGYTVAAELLVLHPDAERYAATMAAVRAYEFEGHPAGPTCPYVEQQVDVQVLVGTDQPQPAITVPATVFVPGPVLLDLADSATPVLAGDWLHWASPEPEPAAPWSTEDAQR